MTEPTAPDDDVTGWLAAWRGGDPEAMERLMPMMHATLRTLAAKHLQHEDRGHTLSPTALVHEAWLRLVHQRHATLEDRGHFVSLASRVMRRVLVDHARHLNVGKRVAPNILPHDLEGSATADWALTVIAVDDALDRLAEVDERLARVVECRFYAGLTEEETAEVLGITARTVHRNWLRARGWLEIALGD